MTRDRSICIKNVYYMLCYAFTALRPDGYEDVAAEEFEHLHDLFAAMLAKGLGRQRKQGLYRTYQDRAEDATALRGKLDLPGTIRNWLSRRRALCCEYDELSEDNPHNRILKATALLLLRHGEVAPERKAELKRELRFLSNVAEIDPASIRWSALRFHRNNDAYRMLIGICRLVLEGMLLTTERGEHRLASFLDEQRMSRLYEKFLLEYFRRECPRVRANASRIDWALDDGADALLPDMWSDITLTRGDRVLIIDAKYYAQATREHFGARTLHSQNLYQIFTYVKNRDAAFGDRPHAVSGMLLYAQTDERIQPDATYQMSGNRIQVRTLDLDQDFKHIAASLNRIVEENFGCGTGELVQ